MQRRRGAALKRRPGGCWPAGWRNGGRFTSLLFGGLNKAADKRAALVGAAPLGAQTITLEAVLHRDGGHRMRQLRQRRIPGRFVAASVILGVHGTGLDLG